MKNQSAMRQQTIARVRLVAEDVGGDTGRTVSFDIASGTLTVRSVRGGERVL